MGNKGKAHELVESAISIKCLRRNMSMQHDNSQSMHDCIAACHACHISCLSMASGHCLEMGGPHAAPQHIRLMLDCAQICATAVDFMVRESEFHADFCRLCAQICRACEASCRDLDGMENCADACRRCAEACDAMAANS
jgi:hypothetical protein